jgi:hypothetical protein
VEIRGNRGDEVEVEMRGNRGEERERDDDENQSVDGEVGTMQVEGVEGREGEGVEWRSKESGDSDDDDDDRRGIIHPSIPKPKVRNEKRTLVRMKKKIQMQRGTQGQRDHYNETSKTERVSKEASSRQKKTPNSPNTRQCNRCGKQQTQTTLQGRQFRTNDGTNESERMSGIIESLFPSCHAGTFVSMMDTPTIVARVIDAERQRTVT